MKELFQDPLFAAFYGFILFNFGRFVVFKDENLDNKPNFLKKGTKIKAYFWATWDNWVWSLLFIPVVAYNMEDIVIEVSSWFNWNLTPKYLYYFSTGIVSEGAYVGIKKLFKLFPKKNGNN